MILDKAAKDATDAVRRFNQTLAGDTAFLIMHSPIHEDCLESPMGMLRHQYGNLFKCDECNAWVRPTTLP